MTKQHLQYKRSTKDRLNYTRRYAYIEQRLSWGVAGVRPHTWRWGKTVSLPLRHRPGRRWAVTSSCLRVCPTVRLFLVGGSYVVSIFLYLIKSSYEITWYGKGCTRLDLPMNHASQKSFPCGLYFLHKDKKQCITVLIWFLITILTALFT